MVLCAGLGTRLGVLSDERPKPLLPVCDIPVVRYVLAWLAGSGVTEACINLHHRGEDLVAELGERAFGLRLRYSPEPVLLGTGGGLERQADWLTRGGVADFLVANGKLIVDADLAALSALAPGAVAAMALREVPDPERWGAVETDAGRVLRINGRGAPGVATRTGMFTGVHRVSPALLSRLPPARDSHVITAAYQPALEAGERVAALFYPGYFAEHSTPRRYLDGNFALLRGAASLRFPPGPLTGVDPTAEVHPGAVLAPPYRVGAGARVAAGARVGPDAVVGRGATVESGAELREAVAWPGTRVRGVVRQAIVTSAGVVPVAPG